MEKRRERKGKETNGRTGRERGKGEEEKVNKEGGRN